MQEKAGADSLEGYDVLIAEMVRKLNVKGLLKPAEF